MQLVKPQRVQTPSCFPDMAVVLLTLLSTVVVQAFRGPSHRWIPAMWLETAIFLCVPVVAFTVFTWKRTGDEGLLKRRAVVIWLQGGALLMVLLVLVVQWLSREGGLGDANEIVALLVVQTVAWYLAVFSRFGSFSKVAFMLSGSLVLFVCFMAENATVLVISFVYATVSLWWLLGSYWNRLNVKALDAHSKTLPVNGFAIVFTVALLSAIGVLAWVVVPPNTASAMRGFSPFSGGDHGTQSDFARSGIGDGNMLTSGDNATTSGAVDSDQFIEDDKPSIYDIMSEEYDGPMKIRTEKNRAVALDAVAKHLHEVIQSEQAGKVFRTVRESKDPQQADLENRVSEALFFVEGSVPARFAIDSFQHFDGWDWSKVALDSESARLPPIAVEQHQGEPWYVVRNLEREYLPVTRAHRVSVLRLDTNVLPACSFVKGWHIHKVDDPNMFFWNDVGLIRMDGDFIPSQTVIDVVTSVPNYHTLRSSRNLQLVDHPNPLWERLDTYLGVGTESGTSVGPEFADVTGSPFLQVPDNESKGRIVELAQEWTKGHSKGWNEVEAIVARMRADYVLSPMQTAPPDGGDTVGAFLDQGGGPSYLFATTATQLLRAAGYRTRLATGFLVEEKHYDRVANQSVVTAENVHMWPEVCLDGWHWIPVEPTPGYPIPYSHQTVWQWTKAQIVGACRWIIGHPVISILVAGVAICLFRFRRELVVVACWLRWLVAGTFSSAHQLSLTRKLIDARFWAAGVSRPESVPVSVWFGQVDRDTSRDFSRYWQIQNYRSRPLDASVKHQVTSACRSIVSQLSLHRIRLFAKTLTSKVVQ